MIISDLQFYDISWKCRFESLPLRKKLGNNENCFLIFILRKREARLPADAKWKSAETRRRFLISCKGIPKRDGREKRSQFRPQSRQKTKQGKRDSVLVSCKGTPNRDGRAKRSQSLIQIKNGWNAVRRFLISCKRIPKQGWAKSIPNPNGKRLNVKFWGISFYAYNFVQFKKEKIVIFHHPSEQYLDFEILRSVTLRSRMTTSNEFS